MNQKNNFDSVGRRFAVLIALATIGVLFAASEAKAGCGTPSKAEPAAPIPFVSPHGNAPLNHQDDEDSRDRPIVGLWHVVYTATYTTSGPLPLPIVPPGSFQFNQTYKTWHGDGTEWENAFLPPAGGNVCFGVWKDLSHGNVKLHHIGLMFAPDGSGTLVNIFTIDEIDRVSHDGKTYEGTFDMKIFDPTDVLGKGTVLQEIKGTTAATRITAD
jgi:hypothetical protein